MSILTKPQLKALWINGYKPNQTDFANLFDSLSGPITVPAGNMLKMSTNAAGAIDLRVDATEIETPIKAFFGMFGSIEFGAFYQMLEFQEVYDMALAGVGLETATNVLDGSTPFAEIYGKLLRTLRSIRTIHGTSYSATLFSFGKTTDDPTVLQAGIVWSKTLNKAPKLFVNSSGVDLSLDFSSNTPAEIDTKLGSVYNDSRSITLTGGGGGPIQNVFTFKSIVATVSALPTIGNSVGDVYLVGPVSGATGQNLYEEYVWITGDRWERFGTLSTDVDLSNYYTKTQADDVIKTEVENLLGDNFTTYISSTPNISDALTEMFDDGSLAYISDYISTGSPLVSMLNYALTGTSHLRWLEGTNYKGIVGIAGRGPSDKNVISVIGFGTNEPTNVFFWASSAAGDFKALPSQLGKSEIDTFFQGVSTHSNTLQLKDPEALKPSELSQVASSILTNQVVGPGENLNIVDSASGNIAIKLQNGLRKTNYPYFRDTIIDAPAAVTLTFSVYNSGTDTTIYKTSDVTSLTASSGRKVYAIHWVPNSMNDNTCNAFINVANYV